VEKIRPVVPRRHVPDHRYLEGSGAERLHSDVDPVRSVLHRLAVGFGVHVARNCEDR